jgi:hypothetical protein
MPHAAHLCVGADCRFYMATCVGHYIVSTIGEYIPDAPVREMLAECRGIKLEGQGDARFYDWLQKCGYEEVGPGRKY